MNEKKINVLFFSHANCKIPAAFTIVLLPDFTTVETTDNKRLWGDYYVPIVAFTKI